MVVIIKKIDGKPVYNLLHISKEDKMKAEQLDLALAKTIPEIEKAWLKKRMKSGESRKIDIKVIDNIRKKLAAILDNENLVIPSERKLVWKAIRSIYIKSSAISKREESRDDLEYIYRTLRYPFDMLKCISWDGWRRLYDSPSIQQDERFETWFQKKLINSPIIKREFIRSFTKNLYSLIKNKDTSVYSDTELFEIYELAWSKSVNESK